VRWGGEQSLAAMQGLQAAREALLDLQAQSNKQTLNQNAKRYALLSAENYFVECFRHSTSGCCSRRRPLCCADDRTHGSLPIALQHWHALPCQILSPPSLACANVAATDMLCKA